MPPSTPPPLVSFVVPVFNEERVLEASLDALSAFLDGLCVDAGRAARDWELVLVDDGSKDRSVELIEAWAAAHADIPLVLERLPANRGKGAAVRHGMLVARGDYSFFLDADLSTPLEQTPAFLAALESGSDVVIGNRRVPGSEITRRQPIVRETLGKGFTLLVNLFLAPGVHDFTCGFKGFRRDAAQAVFQRSTLDGWAFDAELVVIAQAQNLKLAQLPVSWHHEDDTKVRLLAAVLGSGLELVQIFMRRLAGRYR
ncbi:MAG: glycosyltransferase family 2 protein [Planctomycetota bacterium]|nr:glycosyltransferase family 2 protein [Planctomycetota bacterium]